ncbi:MAG: hypothetical protein ACOYOV_05080 [Bacteroidales bacterium]
MSKYILMDGGIINASNDSEFIDKLRTGSKFESHLTKNDFLEGFINRVEIHWGTKIKLTSENTDENFVKELEKCGYLMKEV